MRIAVAAGLAGFVFAVAPASAMDWGCSSTTAHKAPTIATLVDDDDTREVTVTSRSTIDQNVTIVQRPPAVLGIRQAAIEPPAIYVIEAEGAVVAR